MPVYGKKLETSEPGLQTWESRSEMGTSFGNMLSTVIFLNKVIFSYSNAC